MASSGSNRVYEDFDPPSDLVSEDACDTLLIYLPGFRKEQLRVQLTPSRVLKITGERPIGDTKWRRFQKEFRVPSNCDTKEITAKFEGGILYIRQPKIITTPPTPTPTPTPAQQQPDDKAKAAQESPKAAQEGPKAQPEKDQVPPTNAEEKGSEKKEDSMMAKMKDETHQAPTITPQPQMQKEAQMQKEGQRKPEEERKEVAEKRARVFRGSGLFRELKKPENMKRLAVSVVMVLAVGFYVSYIFKSFMGNKQEKVLGNEQLEL